MRDCMLWKLFADHPVSMNNSIPDWRWHHSRAFDNICVLPHTRKLICKQHSTQLHISFHPTSKYLPIINTQCLDQFGYSLKLLIFIINPGKTCDHLTQLHVRIVNIKSPLCILKFTDPFLSNHLCKQISLWREPILCTVQIGTFGAPGQGQRLDVYLRPDFWVRPRHILVWRLATSLPYRRTAGPNTGLQVSKYVFGIGQTDTSPTHQDPLGSIDTLCGNLHREHCLE